MLKKHLAKTDLSVNEKQDDKKQVQLGVYDVLMMSIGDAYTAISIRSLMP